MKDLESLNKEKEIAVIASNIGMRKKIQFVEYAIQNDIKIYNLKDAQAYIEKVKKHFDDKKKVNAELKKSKETKQVKEDKKSNEKKEKPKEELTDKLEEDKKKVLTKGQ